MTQGYGGKQSVIAGVPWDSDNVRAFLEHSKQKRYVEQGSLYGFELGNEIQGPARSPLDGKVHRGLDAPFHADQFSRLSSMIAIPWARARVAGSLSSANTCIPVAAGASESIKTHTASPVGLAQGIWRSNRLLD